MSDMSDMTDMTDMTDADFEAKIAKTEKLIERLQPLLRGAGREVQMMALAQLVATWLAGHINVDELGCDQQPETAALHEALLTDLVGLINELLPVCRRRMRLQG